MKGVFTMLVIAVIVIILGVVGSAFYSQYKTTGSVDPMLAFSHLIPSPPQPVEEFNLGSTEIITLFSNVSKINLDPSILDNPGYKLLVDNSAVVSNNTYTGRKNPFLPVSATNQARNSTNSQTVDSAPLEQPNQINTTQ